MTKITVFQDESNESQPALFEGHLTALEIAKAARQLGSIGNGGYEGCEVAKTGEDTWLVTYAREQEWEVEPYGIEGQRVAMRDQGSLSYIVYRTEASPV